MSTAGNVTGVFSYKQTAASGILSANPLAVYLTSSFAFTNGTAADMCDLVAIKSFTFVASTLQTVDLTSMLDVSGGAVNFARVKAFVLRMEGTTNGSTLTLAPDASNGWTTGPFGAGSTLVLQAASAVNTAGSYLMMTAPNTTGWVVNGTHKVIDLTPSAHVFTASLLIAGCSV